jgi:hypothetical protein
MPKGPWRFRCLDQNSPLRRTDSLACHPEKHTGPRIFPAKPASTPVMRRGTHEYGTENVIAGMADLTLAPHEAGAERAIAQIRRPCGDASRSTGLLE